MTVDAATEVKSRIDIVDVIGSYVRLQRSGRALKALCPFHSERTPSFTVSQEKQAWYCFGCSEGGDVLSFVMRAEHIDFRQALEMLAERAGVEISDRGARSAGGAQARRRCHELHRVAQAFYEYVLWSLPAGEPGRALLMERGVDEASARRFGVGFAPSGGTGGDALIQYIVQRSHGRLDEIAAAGLAHPPERGRARDRFRHRLVFPIRDERGQTLGFGGRALGDMQPKYLNTPATPAYDKSLALFGIDHARAAFAATGHAVVVEGYFDVMAMHAAGIHNVVASSGTALTTAQVRLLARHTAAIRLCFDADAAGRTAASRAVDLIAGEGLAASIVQLPPGVKDPDELVRTDPQALVRAVAEAQREWQVLLDQAFGDAETGSVEDRRSAGQRVVAVLARIPEATTRQLYTDQAARRLQVAPAAVASDVLAAVRAREQRPARLVVAPPPTPPAQIAAATDAPVDITPIANAEKYLVRIALARPDLVDDLVDRGLDLDHLHSDLVRELLVLTRALAPGQQLPLHQLSEPGRSLAAEMLLRPLGDLGPDTDAATIASTLDGCIRDVECHRLGIALDDLGRRLRVARDAGHHEAADQLAMDKAALQQRLHDTRSGVAGPATSAR